MGHRTVAVLWWLIAGCYHPDIATGVPCSNQGACPRAQRCNPDTLVCEQPADGPDASTDAVDAALPIDASPCDPTEQLIDGACAIPLAASPTTPASSAGCTTGNANSLRSIALDASNRIYLVFRCGGDGFVAVSADSGATLAPPQARGTGIDSIAVAGGPRKVAYVATAGPQGVALAVTQDGGATWQAQTLDATAPTSGWGVSVAASGDAVYVAARLSGTVQVWRNATRGAGTFAATPVVITSVYGDVLVDPASGAVWVTGDSPSLHLRTSVDGGASFAPVVEPAGSYTYSDWSLGGSEIVVSGGGTTFSRISTTTPTTITQVAAGLPSPVTRGRAISATPDETVYVATQASGNALTVHRFPAGASTGAMRAAGTGSGLTVAPGPGTTAAVVFTDTASTQVQLAVYQF